MHEIEGKVITDVRSLSTSTKFFNASTGISGGPTTLLTSTSLDEFQRTSLPLL